MKHPWRNYGAGAIPPAPRATVNLTSHREWPRVRVAGRHLDAAALAERVREWLVAHPQETRTSLARRAGVSLTWLIHLLHGRYQEVGVDQAAKVLRVIGEKSGG